MAATCWTLVHRGAHLAQDGVWHREAGDFLGKVFGKVFGKVVDYRQDEIGSYFANLAWPTCSDGV
jgi:dTDP-4-dehydrorhamnose 3,5-epimerase-like enzyme